MGGLHRAGAPDRSIAAPGYCVRAGFPIYYTRKGRGPRLGGPEWGN